MPLMASWVTRHSGQLWSLAARNYQLSLDARLVAILTGFLVSGLQDLMGRQDWLGKGSLRTGKFTSLRGGLYDSIKKSYQHLNLDIQVLITVQLKSLFTLRDR